jgi:hypothetical protein
MMRLGLKRSSPQASRRSQNLKDDRERTEAVLMESEPIKRHSFSDSSRNLAYTYHRLSSTVADS